MEQGWKVFVKRAKYNFDLNIDFGIYVIGNRGKGKSNFCFYATKILLKEIPNSVAIYVEPTKVIRKLIEIRNKVRDGYKVIAIFDEMKLVADRRSPLCKNQRKIIEFITIQRPYNLVYFYVAPRLMDIDKHLLHPDVINWLVWIRARGEAWVYTDIIHQRHDYYGSVQRILLEKPEDFDKKIYIYTNIPHEIRKRYPPHFLIHFEKAEDVFEHERFIGSLEEKMSYEEYRKRLVDEFLAKWAKEEQYERLKETKRWERLLKP